MKVTTTWTLITSERFEPRIRAAWADVEGGFELDFPPPEAERLILAFIRTVKQLVIEGGEPELHRMAEVIAATNDLCVALARIDQQAAQESMQGIADAMKRLDERLPLEMQPTHRPALASGNILIFGD